MSVAEQAVDAFDLVFGECLARERTPDVGQAQLAAKQKTCNALHQRPDPRQMHRWTSRRQPSVQQSRLVHAAPPDRQWMSRQHPSDERAACTSISHLLDPQRILS
jgi:hypothetical protein